MLRGQAVFIGALLLFSGTASAQSEAEPPPPPPPSHELREEPAREEPVREEPVPAPALAPEPLAEEFPSEPPRYPDRFLDRPLVLPPRLVQVQLWAPQVSSGGGFSYGFGAALSVGLVDRLDVTLASSLNIGNGLRPSVSLFAGLLAVRSERVQLELELDVSSTFVLTLTNLTSPTGVQQQVLTSTYLGFGIGPDTRIRLTDTLALRVGEGLISVTAPPLGGNPFADPFGPSQFLVSWVVGLRLAPALEVQVSKAFALQLRVVTPQVSIPLSGTRPVTVSFGVRPRAIISFGWRCDLVLEAGALGSLGGGVVVSGLAGVTLRF